MVREKENDQQRNDRLARDRLEKTMVREKENDQQQIERLDDQQHRSALNRLNENELRRSVRLASMRQREKASRENENDEKKLRRVRSMSMRRRQKMTLQKQQTQSDRFHWPSAISSQLKEHCLKDFINQMSMPALRQSTCIVCNARTSANLMTEQMLEDIPNRMRLVCHSDLIGTIPETQGVIYKIVS
jgi:hypothetical protein